MPVCITSTATVVSDAQIQAMIPALQTQVTRDLSPAWRVTATVQWLARGATPPPGAWVLTVSDDADVSGALGYHEVDAQGQPLAKVFARTCQQAGVPLSSVISHELLEMLVDPQGILSYFVPDTKITGRIIPCEVCDPVESTLYTIDNIQVSDFITPYWASAAHPSGKVFDHMGVLTNTLQLAPGGYMSYLPVATKGQWKTVFADGREVTGGDPDDRPLRVAHPTPKD